MIFPAGSPGRTSSTIENQRQEWMNIYKYEVLRGSLFAISRAFLPDSGLYSKSNLSQITYTLPSL